MEYFLLWFHLTHRLTSEGWQMIHLPRAGGFGEQDARMVEGIEHVRHVANEVFNEAVLRSKITLP